VIKIKNTITTLIKIFNIIILLFIFGCSPAKLQKPPEVEPTIIEQKIAGPLNQCERGKYYAMIKYRHDMYFYLNSDNKDVALQAAKNLKKINLMIDEITAKGIDRLSNKCFTHNKNELEKVLNKLLDFN